MQLFFTQLLVKTLVIDRVKVEGGGSLDGWDQKGQSSLLLDLLLNFFFSSSNFFLSKKKNSGTQLSQEKREAEVRVNHPISTSNRSMDELSCDRT
jgi:hypothetical protein